MTPCAAILQSYEVDLTNPGQFLGCCGLLELAGRVDAHAAGWFDGQTFQLRTAAPDIVRWLLETPILLNTQASPGANGGSDKSPPVRLEQFKLRLDWWTDPDAVQAGFKTWAGGQTVMGFINGMRQCIRDGMEIGPRLLTDVMPIKSPKPFYFDARLARLTALDAGFSTEHFTTASSPAVELLALIGLQRFRPRIVERRERYDYFTWTNPLPSMIAAAVAHGLVPALAHTRYEFPLVVRTGDKYKAFGPAIAQRSTHAEK